jgi:hypothetical protein
MPYEELLSNTAVQGVIEAGWGSLTYVQKKHTLNEHSHIPLANALVLCPEFSQNRL